MDKLRTARLKMFFFLIQGEAEFGYRAAAFLNLVKLNKALADAETAILLNPLSEKGYFRKSCVLEGMEKFDDAEAAFQEALKLNPQSAEVSRKIKQIEQLANEKKRAQEVQNLRSNVDTSKQLGTFKSELTNRSEESWEDIFSFVFDTMDIAVRTWHETSKVESRAYFLLDKEKTDTQKYAPVVNVDKAFEPPQTHSECFLFLRQYAEDSFAKASC